MAGIDVCLGLVAPYYNLALVMVIMPLFVKLLSMKTKKVNLTPWAILFTALIVYIVEEILTILNGMGIIASPRILTSLFEMVIISLFIYMLLLQKEIVR
ncbi:MAG: hypothetical protein ABIC04_06070 [Nanoarchaeota archaeon]